MQNTVYRIALKGLGTEFSESNQPQDYARQLTNRFINIRGEAEVRPGMSLLGGRIFETGVSASAAIDGIHEFIDKKGNASLFTTNLNTHGGGDLNSYDAANNIWYNNGLALDAHTGSFQPWQRSVQMDNKLIFVNGLGRNQFITNVSAGQQTDYLVYELQALVESGTADGSTSARGLFDSTVSNWLTGTLVRPNDLIINYTQGGYGIVTSVGTSSIEHTAIGTAGEGAGNTQAMLFFYPNGGIIQGSGNQTAGDIYQIAQLVDNNIIPRSTLFGVPDFDNTFIAAAGTDGTTLFVSGVTIPANHDAMGSWVPGAYPIMVNDWIYNATRNAISRVNQGSEGNAILLQDDVSGQTNGDSIVLFKSAMPIATYAHVHYDRLLLLDAREQTKIRVGGPSDPQDFTTSRLTLDSTSLDFGGKQSQADTLLSMTSFLRYLVVGGKQNIYVQDGTQLIADASADVVDLQPVGLFQQGTACARPFANVGSTLMFIANDGVRRFNVTDILAVATDNISEVIKTELRERIATQALTPNQLQCIHYPRRNWVLIKVGDIMYCYNYTPIYVQGQLISGGTWSKFTGKFAECDAFFIRANGDLICANQDGEVFQFDAQGAFDDAGQSINTVYQTAWLTPSGEESYGKISDGRYIRPYFESKGSTVYTLQVSADMQTQRTATSIAVTAQGGSPIGVAVVGQTPIGGSFMVTSEKLPARWRGQQARYTFSTSGGVADRISKFIVYGSNFGSE